MSNHYIRAKKFSLEEILPIIGSPHYKLTYTSRHKEVKVKVKVNTARMLLMIREQQCAACLLQGEYFWLEKSGYYPLHLNLYGKHGNKEIMLTADHILPKSLGGTLAQENLQMLCEKCNSCKGHKQISNWEILTRRFNSNREFYECVLERYKTQKPELVSMVTEAYQISRRKKKKQKMILFQKKQMQYTTKQMREFVEEISFPREFGTIENKRARDYVAEEFFVVTGEKPRISGESQNIIVGNPETARVIIGAHYDSVANTPGADDNASALAVMMAIASRADKDYCFVAFNGEECGLVGAAEFVKNLKNDNLEQVHILEMVGYCTSEENSQKNPIPGLELPSVGNFIGCVTNSRKILDKVETLAKNSNVIGFEIPVPPKQLQVIPELSHLLRSDHAPFWFKNYPAAMWTDTSEFRNPNYHQMTDTPDTLDYGFMQRVANIVLKVSSK